MYDDVPGLGVDARATTQSQDRKGQGGGAEEVPPGHVQSHGRTLPHPGIWRQSPGRSRIIGIMTGGGTETAVGVLLENHRMFLSYLERRVGNRAVAEDILQDAFVKVMAQPEVTPDDDAVVPWFYRVLRNATIDRFRRQATSGRLLELFAREVEENGAPTPEMTAEICACVTRLAGTLKPEYAEALLAVEVDDEPVQAFAARRHLTPGNAAVRVHRARKALKRRVAESCGTCAEHGCRDCSCRRDGDAC